MSSPIDLAMSEPRGDGLASRRAVLRGGAGMAVGALAAAGLRARLAGAQGATPAPDMTTEETEAVLREYLQVLVTGGDFGPYYADDIVVTMEDTGMVVTGHDAAMKAITDLHRVAFTAVPEIGALIVGPGVAALEVVFVGSHTGEFAGTAATNKPVRVPYSVFYALSGGKVTELRIYGLVAGLMLQITGQLPPVATPAG